MTTITCQYSGIQFEARSARAKTHPAVSSVLQTAYRNQRYGETVDAMAAVRKAGGYTTAEEFLALVNDRVSGAVARRRAIEEQRRAEQAESERKAQARRAERQARNALLRQHGFRWVGDWGPDNFDEYEEPSGRPPTNWWLKAPDGEEIAVEKAVQIVSGETTLEAVRAAEAEARRERERLMAEREAEKEAEHQREQAARAVVETVEVERFSYTGFEVIYRHDGLTIYAGRVNGVPAGVVNRYTNWGNDYTDDYRYWCADPEAAGLTRVARPEPGTLASTAEAFWGA